MELAYFLAESSLCLLRHGRAAGRGAAEHAEDALRRIPAVAMFTPRRPANPSAAASPKFSLAALLAGVLASTAPDCAPPRRCGVCGAGRRARAAVAAARGERWACGEGRRASERSPVGHSVAEGLAGLRATPHSRGLFSTFLRLFACARGGEYSAGASEARRGAGRAGGARASDGGLSGGWRVRARARAALLEPLHLVQMATYYALR